MEELKINAKKKLIKKIILSLMEFDGVYIGNSEYAQILRDIADEIDD